MAVKVQLKFRPISAEVVVPETAVADLDGQTVVGVVREGKAHTIPVTAGQRVGGRRTQILQGLHAGEVVMTAGGYGLPDGQPVIIQQPTTTAAAAQ